MKPYPCFDFPIGVRRASRDYPDDAAAYEGIYSAWLNHSVTVVFVPKIARHAPWPPEWPEDVDHIGDQETARRTLLLIESTIVTADDSSSGTHLSLALEEDRVHTIFFVSDAEFAALARELEELATRLHGFYDADPISTLTGTTLADLLLRRILTSRTLSERNMEMLGRTLDGSPRIQL